MCYTYLTHELYYTVTISHHSVGRGFSFIQRVHLQVLLWLIEVFVIFLLDTTVTCQLIKWEKTTSFYLTTYFACAQYERSIYGKGKKSVVSHMYFLE